MAHRHIAAKRTKSIHNADGDQSRAWKSLPLVKLFAAWHLHRGGIEGGVEISRLIGVKVNSRTLDDLHEFVGRLLYGPLPLDEPVRCGNCGCLINNIPCTQCGFRSERYKPNGNAKSKQ
jgi:hypothetical protein